MLFGLMTTKLNKLYYYYCYECAYVHDGLYLCFSSSMEVFKQSLSLLDLNTQTS